VFLRPHHSNCISGEGERSLLPASPWRDRPLIAWVQACSSKRSPRLPSAAKLDSVFCCICRTHPGQRWLRFRRRWRRVFPLPPCPWWRSNSCQLLREFGISMSNSVGVDSPLVLFSTEPAEPGRKTTARYIPFCAVFANLYQQHCPERLVIYQ